MLAGKPSCSTTVQKPSTYQWVPTSLGVDVLSIGLAPNNEVNWRLNSCHGYPTSPFSQAPTRETSRCLHPWNGWSTVSLDPKRHRQPHRRTTSAGFEKRWWLMFMCRKPKNMLPKWKGIGLSFFMEGDSNIEDPQSLVIHKQCDPPLKNLWIHKA